MHSQACVDTPEFYSGGGAFTNTQKPFVSIYILSILHYDELANMNNTLFYVKFAVELKTSMVSDNELLHAKLYNLLYHCLFTMVMIRKFVTNVSKLFIQAIKRRGITRNGHKFNETPSVF